MRLEGDAKRVTIFIGESDRWHHKALYSALIEMLRREGCAGATAIRGIEGFGKNSRIHTANIMRLSEDLPVMITVVDSAARIDAVLPVIDEMVGGGLVIVEDVHVRTYSDASGS